MIGDLQPMAVEQRAGMILSDKERVELLEAFIAATETALHEMANTEVLVLANQRQSIDIVRSDDDISAVVGNLAALGVIVTLDFPWTTAVTLTKRVLADVAQELDDQLVGDCIGEIANVVAGQAKALLAGKPYGFRISLPKLIRSPCASPDLAPKMECPFIVFDCDAGQFEMRLHRARDPEGSFSIRSANAGDAGTLAELRAALFGELGTGASPEFQKAFDEKARAAFQKQLESGACIAWLAEDGDGQFVGCAAMLVFPRLPTPTSYSDREGYLLNVYVIPECRRRNVATALVSAAVAKARELGMARIRLHTTSDGRSIYAAAGFAARDNEMELNI